MEPLKSFSPITLEEVGSVPTVSNDEIDTIVIRSKNAQKHWAQFSVKDKISMLRRLRVLMVDNIDKIAFTVHQETGKPKAEGYNTEVLSSVAMVSYCEELLSKFKFKKKVDQGPMSLFTAFMGRSSYIQYVPFGVIGIISSYNFPFAIPFTQTIMAVAAGNAAIIKPSSDTPLSGFLIADLFKDAGFPEGLVSAIAGPGAGVKLVSCVNKVVFTGGTDTGAKIMQEASKTITSIVLELGGKDAMVVLEDADLDRTVSAAVWGSFVNSGQVCVGIKRIYIHRSIYNDFVSKYLAKVKELKQGDGWEDPTVSVGPMINEREMNRMSEVVKMITDEGGTIMTGGKPADMKGYFFEPTVVSGLPQGSEMIPKEIFGPIVSVFPFDSNEEAVELANTSPYALGGSVWTKDIKKGENIASKIDVGTVDINNAVYTYGLPATPWGGMGKSGFGATHGIDGFMQMLHPHHIHIDHGKHSRDPWWMPYTESDTQLQKEMAESFFGDKGGKIAVIRKIMKSRDGKI